MLLNWYIIATFLMFFNKYMNEQKKSQTILHELFHGNIKEHYIIICGVDEEYFMDIFETAMLGIIKDNRELANYIGSIHLKM